MTTLDPKLIPVGLPWCREEDYGAFRMILEDADKWSRTWHDFVCLMEKVEDSWKKNGKVTTRVNINPRIFSVWCAKRRYRVDSDSCYKFAAEIAIKTQRSGRGLARDVGED